MRRVLKVVARAVVKAAARRVCPGALGPASTERRGRGLRALARPLLSVSALTVGLALALGSAFPASAALATKPLPEPGGSAQDHAKLGPLRPADVLVVAGKPLPSGLAASLRRLTGVTAAVPVDAGRIRVNGVFVNV